MNRSSAMYLSRAKAVLGNPAMSERELGELLGGYSQPMIAKAKAGNMSDPLALRLAEVIGVDPGEVLTVARAEREKDEKVKAALMAYASKTLAVLPSKTAQVERGGMAAMVDQLAGTKRRAAAVLLSVGLVGGGLSAPSPAEAAVNGGQLLDAVHYVKRHDAENLRAATTSPPTTARHLAGPRDLCTDALVLSARPVGNQVDGLIAQRLRPCGNRWR